jgi:hypothetical protein
MAQKLLSRSSLRKTVEENAFRVETVPVCQARLTVYMTPDFVMHSQLLLD